jgi:hypothetical protein
MEGIKKYIIELKIIKAIHSGSSILLHINRMKIH